MLIHHNSLHARETGHHAFYTAYCRRLLALLIICAFFSSALLHTAVSAQGTANSDAASSTAVWSDPASAGSDASSLLQTSLLDPAGAGSPAVEGKAYVLYDAQSGTFLLGKNQDTPLSPASITKVMTVLLAFEHLKLTDTITVTRDMFKDIPNDYVRLGLVDEEVITVEEALYACLLISANDAAMALALAMGGSEAGFVAMMNEKATELGCHNTNFTNPYGYADKDHLTTAHDMALIMAEALRHDLYTTISTTRNYPMQPTNKFAEPRGIISGNRFVSSKKYAYADYIGGKTGYTDMSGYTIVAGARHNGRTLISVILGASRSEVRYANLISLFDYGFTAYSTDRVDPAEFESIKAQALAQVTSDIEEAGYALMISGTALNLDGYITTASTTDAGGYRCSIDMSRTAVQPDLADQVLQMPLYRQYNDGTTTRVGTLEVTVLNIPPSEASSEDGGTPARSAGRIILGIAVMLILAAVLLFCIFAIYVMIRRERRRRRKRRIRRIR
ncbi:MAG: D-alanyl-D-alanine carboxypeptidase family protein [Saccharofermentanales bacterium]